MSDDEIIKFLVEIRLFMKNMSKKYFSMNELIRTHEMSERIEKVISRLKGEV